MYYLTYPLQNFITYTLLKWSKEIYFIQILQIILITFFTFVFDCIVDVFFTVLSLIPFIFENGIVILLFVLFYDSWFFGLFWIPSFGSYRNWSIAMKKSKFTIYPVWIILNSWKCVPSVGASSSASCWSFRCSSRWEVDSTFGFWASRWSSRPRPADSRSPSHFYPPLSNNKSLNHF